MSVMHLKRRRRVYAFTLIELLVVIAILGILMGLLFPAVKKARERSRVTRAMHDVGQLEIALRAYMDEYRYGPTNILTDGSWPADINQVEELVDGIPVAEPVLIMLAGKTPQGEAPENNPKMIPFCEGLNPTNDAGAFIDPWGSPYKFMLDYDRDRRITVNFTGFDGQTNVYGEVAVWSAGPDGSDQQSLGGWEDDIRSWQ